MRLVHASEFFKKFTFFFGTAILFIYFATEIGPDLWRSIFTPAPVEREIKYKFNPIVFPASTEFQTGSEFIDISTARIFYRRDVKSDWNNLNEKTSKIFTYNTNIPEDIDYLRTAKQVGLFLGYTDDSLISTGISDDNIIWAKPEDTIQFVINKRTKKMEQKINSIPRLKNYLTAGEFINDAFPIERARQFLTNTQRFTSNQINQMDFETTFLRFEGDNLIESPILSSELAYVRAYYPLSGKKVVGNNYDLPTNFMYVASLRPEIIETKRNYRYPRLSIYKNEYQVAFEDENFDLNPLEVVVDNVVNSKDFVIRGLTLNNLPHSAPKPKNIKIENISIESFEVGYFDDMVDGLGRNSLIQPIYIFKGNFDTADGQRGKIILYTPAVHPKYYN